MEFTGIIRFCYQESKNKQKCSTKCLRVSNTTTCDTIISILVDKFSLSTKSKSSNSLWEVPFNRSGKGRLVQEDECPLLLQLERNEETYFLLKSDNQSRKSSLLRHFTKNSNDELPNGQKKLFCKLSLIQPYAIPKIFFAPDNNWYLLSTPPVFWFEPSVLYYYSSVLLYTLLTYCILGEGGVK